MGQVPSSVFTTYQVYYIIELLMKMFYRNSFIVNDQTIKTGAPQAKKQYTRSKSLSVNLRTANILAFMHSVDAHIKQFG